VDVRGLRRFHQLRLQERVFSVRRATPNPSRGAVRAWGGRANPVRKLPDAQRWRGELDLGSNFVDCLQNWLSLGTTGASFILSVGSYHLPGAAPSVYPFCIWGQGRHAGGCAPAARRRRVSGQASGRQRLRANVAARRELDWRKARQC
jgi:hypothetical protein